MLENVADQLTETLKEQASAEEKQQFEEDGRHSRVQFAVGSYNEITGKARLLRGDGSGNFVAVNEAVGQPGGVYLIIPSFMNSSGKRRIVHLMVENQLYIKLHLSLKYQTLYVLESCHITVTFLLTLYQDTVLLQMLQ